MAARSRSMRLRIASGVVVAVVATVAVAAAAGVATDTHADQLNSLPAATGPGARLRAPDANQPHPGRALQPVVRRSGPARTAGWARYTPAIRATSAAMPLAARPT